MWFCLIADLLLCPEFHKGLQHHTVSPVPVPDQSIQFAVGKGACASLSELHIGIRVQLSRLPESFHILPALLHAFPTLQQYGTVAVQRQEIAAEQSRRPCSHNDNGQSAHAASRFRETVNLLLGFAYQVLFPLESAQNPALLFHLQIQRVNIENLRLLPGVDGLADYPHLPDVPRRNPQHPRGLCFYVGS